MPTIDLFELRNHFAMHDVLTCFNGPFSHGLIEEFGVAVRQHLEQRATERSDLLDVFAVYVELAQNVRNYVTTKGFTPGQPHNPDCAIITILWDGERFAVAAGNVVTHEDGSGLATRIDELNAMDKDGLRRRFKAQLRAPRPANSLGAGLGLLEIARRAGAPLTVARTPLAADWEFFSILVRI
ncbi:SiaB family protein kinase [uncultured Thiodictyon sp.]|uniref:SiaB family protein kinase n=1 Tax=uncultured Thiodictyon sp. TaxID=1846217 RepID=UPI0025F334E6|nr:SiaB family protein kinase [uncultured Thiodictyon sp.]